MPNAVLEAMAHGIPVVASDVGGVRSLLGSGAGIIVAPGDDQALADALRRLIDDPSLRAEMGDKGRGLAQGSLSVEAMRDATLSAISDIRERQSRVRSSSRTRLRRKWWT
jgi:glycosyltransferase involved in cell wall biosynthesis